ncbi:hypothetical protein Mgra_00007098, partial [Meloidogyne graminicola]
KKKIVKNIRNTKSLMTSPLRRLFTTFSFTKRMCCNEIKLFLWFFCLLFSLAQPQLPQQHWIDEFSNDDSPFIVSDPRRSVLLETHLRNKVPSTDRRVLRQTQTGEVNCNAPWDGICPPPSYFDPVLAGGINGGAGIKARLNQRAFQYLSTIASGILNYYIKRARLPNIQQCIPQFSGCINVYNLYVSRFRCPERVLVYPAPPNQIVLDVHNLDIGVTGNLGGQIVILIPIALFGIIQVNAHQVSVRVGVTIAPGANGGPVLRMVSCAASVGFVDNGGLVGDIANSHFRGKISELVRQQIPGQLCQRLPGILDTEVNSKISQLIPRNIPLSQLLQIALNAFGLENLLSGGNTKRSCPAHCKNKKLAAHAAATSSKNSTILVLPPNFSNDKLIPTKENGRNIKNNEENSLKLISGSTINSQNKQILSRPFLNNQQQQHGHTHLLQPIKPKSIGRGNIPKIVTINVANTMEKTKINPPTVEPLPPRAQRPVRNVNNKMAKIRDDRATPSDSGRVTFLDPGENLCENCTNTATDENPLAFLTTILQSMDLRKLNNIYLNIQLLQTYASTRDFTIDINGGFSVCGRGCTPFGPFPMQFPPCVNCKMVEVLISDYSINSLLYHLHNTGFIRIRIGPETPKFGDLLKTTCGESEDEGGDTELEDHGVETEESEGGASTAASINVEVKKKALAKTLKTLKRLKRQDSSDLTSLGICLGDILPVSVREKFPNQRVYIIISTERAPSVQISAANGGTALINAVLNAEFHIESTNTVVGTIRIDASLIVTVRAQGNRITAHANISRLNLQDVGNQLGLPQDALDNLGTLGKDILLKSANDALEKGTELNIPSNIEGLPFTIVNPSINFLEHALIVQTDFTLDPNALGGYEPCPATRTCCKLELLLFYLFCKFYIFKVIN